MGVEAELVVIHAAGPQWSYKLEAALAGAPLALLQEVEQGAALSALSAERGDMFVYDSTGLVELYLLARRPDLDFNEAEGYAWMVDQIAALSARDGSL